MFQKKSEKFNIPSKYILLFLTILCIVLMVITFTTNYASLLIRTPFAAIVIPFQTGVTNVGNWFGDRSDELSQISDLLEENTALKAELAELKVENDLLQQDKYELSNLRQLYQLDNQYSEYEKVGARIIARDTGNWFHSFTIDKGLEDGLAIDMNVIADGGLVGRISEIGTNWAKVVSIIDDNSYVSGMVLSTSDNLIVSGDLELMTTGNISFSQLMDSADQVTVGDKIVTSNISDKYLPGISIGYITEVNKDANNLTKSGTVSPVVDFEHLKEVLVILQLKQTVQ
ncbi:MAG: rod shape-determining protein MreC [Eubacteriales bacterium]